MSSEDPTLMGKIFGGVGAALAAISTWAWTHTHKRIDEKADKEAFDKLAAHVDAHSISRDLFEQHVANDERQLAAITDEIDKQRGHTEKIFDLVRGIETQAHSRHVELLNAIHGKNT
jgi:hypothetical protein